MCSFAPLIYYLVLLLVWTMTQYESGLCAGNKTWAFQGCVRTPFNLSLKTPEPDCVSTCYRFGKQRDDDEITGRS